jgi:hypothetical protein
LEVGAGRLEDGAGGLEDGAGGLEVGAGRLEVGAGRLEERRSKSLSNLYFFQCNTNFSCIVTI